MRRENWTLLTIASGNQPLTPAQLQKSIFLIQKNFEGLDGIKDYNFVPYNYGPFDRAVYQDAESLEAEGLVASVPSGSGRWVNYVATAKGRDHLEKVIKVDKKIQEEVSSIVELTQSLSFNALVREIYKEFPEMKINSIFRG